MNEYGKILNEMPYFSLMLFLLFFLLLCVRAYACLNGFVILDYIILYNALLGDEKKENGTVKMNNKSNDKTENMTTKALQKLYKLCINSQSCILFVIDIILYKHHTSVIYHCNIWMQKNIGEIWPNIAATIFVYVYIIQSLMLSFGMYEHECIHTNTQFIK